MDVFTVFLISGFFFIMGAAIVGLMWYFQRVVKRTPGGTKNTNSTDPNLSELARLMRHLKTQDLVVKIDGKNFMAASELSQTQHRRLSLASDVLAKWLSLAMPESQTTDVAPAETATPAEEQAMEDFLSMTAEPKSAETYPGYTPPFAAESIQEIKPVSTQLPDMVGGFLNPTPKPEGDFKSIASQINDILQEQLVSTPLAARGITVNDGQDRGVMVTLDGKQYQGVMDVPDEEVRRAIRSAVLEWETRK
jgi:hypothetical protein